MYRLGAVACLKLLATENMPRITVKLHIVDYSRQWISAIHWRISTKRSRKFSIGSALKTYSWKVFRPTPKNKAWEIASNLCQLIEYGRQSKACNFETAQHIDKLLSYVSSRINVLENGTKLGANPRVFCNLNKTLLNYKWSVKNLRILYNSAKFSAPQPY